MVIWVACSAESCFYDHKGLIILFWFVVWWFWFFVWFVVACL